MHIIENDYDNYVAGEKEAEIENREDLELINDYE